VISQTSTATSAVNASATTSRRNSGPNTRASTCTVRGRISTPRALSARTGLARGSEAGEPDAVSMMPSGLSLASSR
jgi:hypothetical protein